MKRSLETVSRFVPYGFHSSNETFATYRFSRYGSGVLGFAPVKAGYQAVKTVDEKGEIKMGSGKLALDGFSDECSPEQKSENDECHSLDKDDELVVQSPFS